MNTQVLVTIVAVAIVAAAGFWWYAQRRRREHLRSRFGPEYERTVRETADASKAEAILENRERRVDALPIRALTREESSRFSEAWRGVQSRFVDDPKAAVGEADKLITEVMSARGYPMADWDQRVADLSVNYPRTCEQYRAGHNIALKLERGEASTEDLRLAMMNYRELFADLVQPVAEPAIRDRQRRAG